MTGAIEFLRKAKAICNSIPVLHCGECPINDICGEFGNMKNEANIVRKVIEYRLEVDCNESKRL